MSKRGLGKGLGALLPTANTAQYNDTNNDYAQKKVIELKIVDIEPSIDQPRKNFDDEKLLQLSDSIKQHGIIQPIVVKRDNETYKIIAGERRWRAARLAGLTTIPVIIKDLSSSECMEIALIENLQREDLNPIEEAEAYEKLIKEYKLTQEELSARIGKSRSAIANSKRLLLLCTEIKNYLKTGEITSGHARALLPIQETEIQKNIAEMIIRNSMNVRDTERLVKKYLLKKEVQKSVKYKLSEEFIQIEDRLKNIFGTKVKLMANDKKGKIMIEYYSNDELDRILEMVSILEESGNTMS